MPFPYAFPAQLTQRKIIVNIAFFQPGRHPAAWYQYQDVSDYVLQIYIRRGRQHELDRFEAGTCKIVLDNRDRRFDPFNTLGPYYQNVLPMRRVRVSIAHGPNLYHIFTGFIEAWPQSWPHPGHGVVELEAVDGFKLLSLARVSGSFSQTNTATRIHEILNAADWRDPRNIPSGQSYIQAVTLNNVPALSHLQEVTQTENGRIFCGGDGSFTFHDRHWHLRYNWSYATFGDRPGELPYENIVVRYDDSHLWNDVTVERLNGATYRVTDESSIDRFFRRALVRERVPLTTDAEAYDAAVWLLSRYKQPVLRVERISINVFGDPNLPGSVLPREIGDRIRVVRRPPGSGSGAIAADYHIEGIEWDITREAVRVNWQLSLADITAYWVLGHSELSVLDYTTRLGY